MEITGLKLFADKFSEYKDKYVLIGGSACFLNLDEAGIGFRATKDLDIVLILEVDSIDTPFAGALWSFIEEAGYEIKKKSNGKPIFYRFAKPKDNTFPYMLELFSRRLEKFFQEVTHLSPIPVDNELSSLSAILLDDDYYNLVLKFKKIKDNISYVSPECIIPLKAKAYMDLLERKNRGERIDKTNIKKHKNDIFRVIQLISEDINIDIPETIRDDLRKFFKLIIKNPPNLKSLGISKISFEKLLAHFIKAYSLNDKN